MGLFDKKYCDICGAQIKLFGNKKVEDGNVCKDCASKLSPFFSDRRKSTVNEIKQQLQYRQQNQINLQSFSPTKVVGNSYKVYVDDNSGKFVVCNSDYRKSNADLIDLKSLYSLKVVVVEDKSEIFQEDKDGNEVSYQPPRYEYSFDFYIILNVNHKYFNEMRFRLNENSLCLEYDSANGFGSSVTTKVANVGLVDKKDPSINLEYRRYLKMGESVVQVLTDIIDGKDIDAPTVEEKTETPVATASTSWKCSACGGENTGNFCEYCGTPRP